ncbi:hypothetical protein BKK81_11835 [Cupriavidus sp. USMAHM13]|uniref:M35 family metallo-endopeptidase n=1 Tax=Cupriavidus sp. USMAHM13 TaxID=1389192 RepID=UPI0008A6DF63|nr:M35 family metallo-endopeptidase [Cupriavidus sp. USMAHM13]AOY99854.1 hypothetical protein BKK81_11835 [Cupriavidus sp. USMAHM13]
MTDLRYALTHGDKSSTGGALYATCADYTIDGKSAGVEGDFATCPACKSGGPVFNEANPIAAFNGKHVLVAGARVHCRCATRPTMSSSQTLAEFEVFSVAAWLSPAESLSSNVAPAASNKLIEDMQDRLYAEDDSLICPNMSNAEFHATMMRLRDKAVGLMGDRLGELERWSEADRDKVVLWFGEASHETRKTLRDGLTRMREIMRGLRESNFERHSEEGLRRVGCVPRAKGGELPAAASVCKPDGSYTIFIGTIFCRLEDERVDAKTRMPIERDSKLSTLIHEVSHFPQAMDSEDPHYSFRRAREAAQRRDAFCIANADSIAAYVVNVPNWDYKKPLWRP